MDTTSNTPEPEELSESSRVKRNPARKNIWTTALQLWAWLNVTFVGLAYFGLLTFSLFYIGFQQLADVTKTPSSALFYIALGLGLVVPAGSVWIALSLSTSSKVMPFRRLIALSSLIVGNIFVVLFSILFYSLYAVIIPILVSVLALLAWLSSYRKVNTVPVRGFSRFKLVLLIIVFTPITSAGTFYLNTLLQVSIQMILKQDNVNLVQDIIKEEVSESEANMVWRNAQAYAAFDAEDVNAKHIAEGAKEAGLDYDFITGKLTTTNGVWYICITGPQSQRC